MTPHELAHSSALVAPRLWIGGSHAPIPEPVELVVTLEDLAPPAVRGGEVRSPFQDSRWVPVDREAVLTAVDATEGPQSVLIRCRHGLNRSGLVAALLLRRRGMTAEQAMAAIRQARPGALGNPYFADLARNWPHDPMSKE